MADRFPLILNTSANQIQEIASGDQLDLSGVNIANTGIITASTFKGDGDFVELDVDGHTNLDNVSIAGVSTFTGNADFSAGVDVTGDINVTSTLPVINLIDSNNNDDFAIKNVNGVFTIRDATNGADRLTINSNGKTNFPNDVELSSILTIESSQPTIQLNDTNANDDFAIRNVDGVFGIRDITNGADRFTINSSGVVNIPGNTDFGAGIDVTGNATVSGNLSVSGVLTYEDVTNVDSVGIVTARNGLRVTGGTSTFSGAIDANGDLDVDGHTELDNVRISGFTTTSNQILITTPNSKAASITTQNMPLVVRAYSGSTTGITTVLFDSLYQRHPEFVFQGSHNGNWDGTSHWRLLWKSTDNGTTDEIVQIKPITDIGGSIQYAEIKVTDNSTGMKNCARFSAQQQSFLANNQPVFFINQTGIGITDTIYHHSDTDTKIRFPSNDTIRFETAGSQRLNIASNGTVTINGNLDAVGGIDATANSTFAGDVDVDGHTNLDNVNVVGVVTVSQQVHTFAQQITGDNQDSLDFTGSSSNNNRGIAFDSRTAISAATGNNWLRLNNNSEFTNGVYTPLSLRADGGFDVGGNTVVNASAQINGSRILTGTIPVAQIGTGTKNTTTFYRGDGTFQTINTDLVSDTSPQLGGDLDCNNKVVTLNDSTGAGNNRLKIGNAGDLQLFHMSDANYVSGEVDGKDLYVRSRRDLHLVCGNNASGYRNVIYADNNGTARLYHPAQNAVRLNTTTTGVVLTGGDHSASGTFEVNDGVSGDCFRALNGGAIKWCLGTTGTTGNATVSFDARTYSTNKARLHKWTSPNRDGGSYGQYSESWYDGGSYRVITALSSGFAFDHHVLPGANDNYDLGNSSLRWRNVYTNDLNLSNEGGANEVDGTWGNYTIQEGESDLFLINKRNGKKYKFNLTEVV